jgi:hypothetical protein
MITALLAAGAIAFAAGQDPVPPAAAARVAPGLTDSAGQQVVELSPEMQIPTGPRVFLMTVGQGDAVWEKFGHNAIWIRDDSTAYDVAFNYGIFDTFSDDFISRLVRGEMLYRVEGYPGTRLVEFYVVANRTVWVQELNLTLAERLELKSFLEWNTLPENKDYLYDYYRDNCSTRVRDALDRVMGGSLRQQLGSVETGTTYRWHTARLAADIVPAYTGLMLALGQPIDQPIDAWQESFVPMRLMAHLRTVSVPGDNGISEPLVLSESVLFEADRAPERAVPPRRVFGFTAIGCVIGLALLLMAAAGHKRAPLVGFLTIGTIATIGVGVFGTLTWLLWIASGHDATYSNENVLQATPLSLVLMPALIAFGVGRAIRFTTILAVVIAGLATLGFVLQLLPGMYQVNGPIIGLALPVHVGLAGGVMLLGRAATHAHEVRAAAAGHARRE